MIRRARTVGDQAGPCSLGPVVQYPPTRTVEQVDNYHGIRVADPYRWLEDIGAVEARAWIEAQNALTADYLAAVPGRDAIGARLTAMWNHQRVSVPSREGGRLFFTKNSGLQRQPSYYMASGPARGAVERATLILDPNDLSLDGAAQLSLFVPDPTATYAAYGLSRSGSDWRTVKIRRLEDGRDLDDVIDWIRYSGVSWTGDGMGFFYTRYPAPAGEIAGAPPGPPRDAAVYYHRLGTRQSADVIIFQYPQEPAWRVAASVSADGRWLFAFVGRGTATENHLYLADMGCATAPNIHAQLQPVDTTFDASFWPIAVIGRRLYLVTNLDAPRYKVVVVDFADPRRARWDTVIPESLYTLASATFVGGKLFVQYLEDAKSVVAIHDLTGARAGMLPLPGVGTVGGLSGRADGTELFFVFTSFLVPITVYHYDVETERLETFFAPDVPFDGSRYETEQVFYTSADGTQVPMFLTRARGIARNGRNPTLLQGYGGFNVSMLPLFTATVAVWLELGGVYAVANVRGGGEYGRAWHQAGQLDRKQNVFDDFIAAVEWLIASRHTSPERLGLVGTSNGALLAAAVMTQRPELCAAVLPAAGVLDMLRFHKFTAGGFWVSEYGSPDVPEQFATLLAYSPLHNLRKGACYPATLITTADQDDRVVPAHSLKWAAALQAAQGCDRPVLLRVEMRASHRYRPLDRAIAEQADILTFAAHHLGLVVASASSAAAQ